ncbi:putative phytanoyl hydroxylase protein [Phialemonium atrogriseum]|uniref:Phytanoyl hydroxylase protein n=1 Tax=Phialemonium atrogriseum TaxID=1093897 RepID=A0AAJ0FKL1_9PEZI|nr:putative phytanoyl hydroxylase protein [Phialemonium atrogriseum]KAK1764190.1 putative phytanoyl hydroxylase protein [Phialemonium atrogriseum]
MAFPSSTTPSTPLYVNDGLLNPEQVGYLHPSSPDEPLDELRSRYLRDGYLFLKGVIPRADVLKAREAYFSVLCPSGVLAPGTAPVDGIFDAFKDKLDYPGIGAGSTDANGRPRGGLFYKDDFCKHPALHGFVSRFTGWGADNILALRRTLLRNNTPGNKAIGVHYDQIFLRHGEDTSVTVWVPMGDIALDGGGLIYLKRSHELGREIEDGFYEKATETGLTEDEAKNAFNRNMMGGGLLADGPREFGESHGRRWLVTEFEAGDVMLHTPYTIHASTINHSPKNTIRLGTDLRYVNSSRPYDARWTNDYTFGDEV